MVIEGVGVDLSVRAASQRLEVKTWPTIHFPLSGILKDIDGVLRSMLDDRNLSDLRAELNNTLHGCLYHALSCAVQLRRGELVNARSRFSGVIESFICLVEGATVGQIRWREPSRRLEFRMDATQIEPIRDLAYSGSPADLRAGILNVLDVCETRSQGDADRGLIKSIRAVLEVGGLP
ncbi:hypothetical protein [Microbacterium aurum]